MTWVHQRTFVTMDNRFISPSTQAAASRLNNWPTILKRLNISLPCYEYHVQVWVLEQVSCRIARGQRIKEDTYDAVKKKKFVSLSRPAMLVGRMSAKLNALARLQNRLAPCSKVVIIGIHMH